MRTLSLLLAACGLASYAAAQDATIIVHSKQTGPCISRYLTGACIEDVNHEIYGGLYSQMLFGESFQEPAGGPANAVGGLEISHMWRPIQRGTARGRFALEPARPFVGSQSQRITFIDGQGEIGIENQGLNRWGLCFQEGKPYEGYVWVRAERPADLLVAMENGDGTKSCALGSPAR